MNTITKTSTSADAVFDRRLCAVTQAVDDYHSYLLSYVHGLTRQWQDAENILQDLWRNVLLHFEEDKISCLPLLRRKAYQLFVDHYRKQVRRGEVLSDELLDVPVQATEFGAYTDEDEAALKTRFWAEYPNIPLTEQQKDVLWLSARHGFTYKEIEKRLGVPASTVGDWIIAGRKALADAINNELN